MFVCVCADLKAAISSKRESTVEESSRMAAEVTNDPETDNGEHFSHVAELLTSMSSIRELLSQAAQSSLEEQERQVELRTVPPVLRS